MLKNQLRLYPCVVFLKTIPNFKPNGKNVHRPVFVPERLKTTNLGAPYTYITYLLEYPFSPITQIKR